jgi:hypothetical protein
MVSPDGSVEGKEPSGLFPQYKFLRPEGNVGRAVRPSSPHSSDVREEGRVGKIRP